MIRTPTSPERAPAARCRGRRRPSAAPLAAALAAAAALGACSDFPTAPPRFETRLAIPAEETTMAVDELLPSTVSVVGGAFVVDLPATSFSETLGEMCSACSLFDGLVVPKPGFTATITGTVSLPDEVAAIEVQDGAIDLAITNDMGFDPIRPSATARGSLTIELLHGATQLASLVVDGEDTAFPSGSTLTRTLDVATATVDDEITVRLVLDSPAGDPVTVDSDAGIAVAVDGTVSATEVRVAVDDRTVSFDATELDLQDIDEEFRERVLGGSLTAEIENPFDVSGSMELRFTGPGVDIRKSFSVGPGQSTEEVDFTGAELQSMLGKVVTVSGTGSVSAADGVLTVRPGQVLTIDTRLELTLEIGGSSDPE